MRFIILGYLALYWTIWLHEVAHSYMYKKYGCKKESFLRVTVPFYLLFSNPLPVDIEKAEHLIKKQIFNINIAGVIANIALGLITSLALIFISMTSEVNLILLYSFAVFNFTEVAAYLIINNIFLSSDMKGVAAYNQKYRILAFLVGLAAIAAAIYLLYIAPITIVRPIAILSILVAISISIGQIIFERKNK